MHTCGVFSAAKKKCSELPPGLAVRFRSDETYGSKTFGGMNFGGMNFGGVNFGGKTFGGVNFTKLHCRDWISCSSSHGNIARTTAKNGVSAF